MKIEQGNWDAIFDDIAAASNRDVSKRTAEKIKILCSDVEWYAVVTIRSEIIKMPSPPRNIYGYFYERINEYHEAKHKRIRNQQYWKPADNDKLTSSESLWWSKCHEEINLWHRLHLAEKNPKPWNNPIIDLDAFDQERPPSWSPLIDRLLSGAFKPYQQSIFGDKMALTTYLRKFYESLVQERRTRIPKSQTQKPEENTLTPLLG